jgi:hypothetical protein
VPERNLFKGRFSTNCRSTTVLTAGYVVTRQEEGGHGRVGWGTTSLLPVDEVRWRPCSRLTVFEVLFQDHDQAVP